MLDEITLLTRRVMLLRVVLALVVTLSGFIITVLHMREILPATSLSTLWSLGFGKTHYSSLIVRGDVGLLKIARGKSSQILVANLPQLAYSGLYLFYNHIITRMFLGREWSSLAVVRKPLRVSHPQGQQRSTYFL